MKDATPIDTKLPAEVLLWVKELESSFAVNDGYYLDKAITLLQKFQSGSVFIKTKKIKLKDIDIGDPSEIKIILTILDGIKTLPNVLHVSDVYDIQYVDDEKNLKTGADFTLESTEYLGSVLAMLQSIKAQKNKYLVLKNDIFLYNGVKLKINANTYIYDLLRALYNSLQGKSGEISYEDLYIAVRKNKKFKNEGDDYLKEKIQRYITAKEDGLGMKLKPVELNGKPLIEIIKNYGIRFNNGD